MTIVRHEGKLQVTCDACPATYRRTYDSDDFDILREDILADGWKIERKAGDWTHSCPECWKWADRRLI